MSDEDANSFENRLAKAIQAVKEEKLSAYKAATLYEINRATLWNHINGKAKSTKRGRPSRFTPEQEKNLLSIILTLASWAFAQTKKQVLGIASNYASTLGI